MELITILASIDSSFGGNTRSPQGALDVGEGRGVEAGITRVDGGVALEVDVEGCAEVGGIAELLAFNSIVGLEGVQAHVAVGVDGGLEILEGYLVALRGWRVFGSVLFRLLA